MYGNQGFLSYMTNPCRIILFALLSLISLSTGTVQALAHSSSSKTQSIPFHAQSNVSMTRTTLNKNIGSFFLASIGLSYHSPAQALSSFSTTFLISSLFDDIQNELTSPSGGIAYLQSCIDTRDFTSILDFTKEYDIDFRKEKMGKARKTLQDKEKKEKALYYVNAVTFDLIGTCHTFLLGLDCDLHKMYFNFSYHHSDIYVTYDNSALKRDEQEQS